jgi:hypothetical protein
MSTTITVTALLLINFLAILLARPDRRFWLGPVLIWLVTLVACIGVRTSQNQSIQRQEAVYHKSTEKQSWGDTTEYWKLKDMERRAGMVSRMALTGLGLQTVITFVLQVFGYYKTRQKRPYTTTAGAFGAFSLLYLLLELLMVVVPSTGFVR